MPIDYSEYPANWLTEIRPRIMRRAGELRTIDGIVREAHCEWCGVENHRPNPRTGSLVVLTVAHLDHDKDNHDVADDRLAALCQGCHLGYDMPRHVYKRKYGSGEGQLQLIESRETL